MPASQEGLSLSRHGGAMLDGLILVSSEITGLKLATESRVTRLDWLSELSLLAWCTLRTACCEDSDAMNDYLNGPISISHSVAYIHTKSSRELLDRLSKVYIIIGVRCQQSLLRQMDIPYRRIRW